MKKIASFLLAGVFAALAFSASAGPLEDVAAKADASAASSSVSASAPSPDARPRVIELTIKDHRFSPEEISIAPDEKVILHVVNKDESSEEFESRYLKREKIVPGNSAIDVAIGPLKSGTYDFKGDFHEDTAKGRVLVTQPAANVPAPAPAK